MLAEYWHISLCWVGGTAAGHDQHRTPPPAVKMVCRWNLMNTLSKSQKLELVLAVAVLSLAINVTSDFLPAALCSNTEQWICSDDLRQKILLLLDTICLLPSDSSLQTQSIFGGWSHIRAEPNNGGWTTTQTNRQEFQRLSTR